MNNYSTPEEAMYLKQLERMLSKHNDVQEKLGRPKLRLESGRGQIQGPGARGRVLGA